MNNIITKVGVIGFGAWGTAIADILSHNVQNVICYTRNFEDAQKFNKSQINKRFFPDVTLSNNVTVTSNIGDLIDSDFLCIVIPTQQVRHIIKELVDACKKDLIPPLVIGSKGLERGSYKLISQIIEDEAEIKFPLAVLSGPNFAKEVVKCKPTASTIACRDSVFRKKLLSAFSTNYFKPEMSDDLIGVQVCGAFKNVLAIAAGIIRGLDLGNNAYASLLTRGLHEMRSLIEVMGGNPGTINSFAGVGDLILTCGSNISRNSNFGYQLGKNGTMITNETVEGIFSAKAFKDLADSLKIQLEILDKVFSIIHKGLDPMII